MTTKTMNTTITEIGNSVKKKKRKKKKKKEKEKKVIILRTETPTMMNMPTRTVSMMTLLLHCSRYM